jgi:hypothetical protein
MKESGAGMHGPTTKQALRREGQMGLCRFAVVLGISLCCAVPALAMHPLATDDTGTQGPGGVLIESSFNYLKDNEYRSTVVPLALTAGIGKAMDAAVELPYLWLRPSAVTGQPQSGPSDVLFRFKHRFYEQGEDKGGPEEAERSLAYVIGFSQPTGNEEEGLGAGRTRWSARLIGSTALDPVEIIANLGYDTEGKALRRGNLVFDYAVSLSVAVEYEKAEPWEPVLELAVIRIKTGDGYERLATALAGIIYEPSERYYLDAGVRVGLNERSGDDALLAGFGYTF